MRAAVVALLLGACSGREPAAGRPRVVVVSIDGLRPEFYLDPGWRAVVLQAMAREGAHARRVESVYPSVTYPAHATLVTGVRPARHGVVANTKLGETGPRPEWYWDAKDVHARTLWQAAREAGLTVAITYWPCTVGAEVDWLIPERWAVLPTESTPELLAACSTPRGLFQAAMLAGGMPRETTKLALDAHIARQAAFVLRKYRPDLHFVHLGGVDEVQHKFGRDGPEVREAVGRADGQVATLREAAADAVFVVVGDHGFAEVREAVAPNTLLAAAGLIDMKEGRVSGWRAFGHASGGSMAVYARDPESAHAARKALMGQPLWTIVQSGDPKAAFGLEGVEGVAFSNAVTGPLAGLKTGKGQHGYLPSRPGMETGFILWGPGIGVHRIDSISLVDVAPTVAALIGLDLPDAEGRPWIIR